MRPEWEREDRRRSPGWVRSLDGRDLHALAFGLRNLLWEGTISDRQDWLLGACISELEYRRRRAIRLRSSSACSCELCLEPFPPEGGMELPEEPF